ncbi:arsenate reductase (glutaredoxin) [Roseobacter sp. N2S]|uniref:arsenate reductase (glutaredoxin) n=1 Tax=Roseobacter sp. N2S TaxID=2663844 RepID=UPI0028643A3E|nr:arsenate reductase (glutaredoxin) [Roseobacter sp. N2S]MDR6263843.1 arsenate reductase [Roseobacter sp. N2S]
MTLTIWHNPRCSKSRQTLDLLQTAGHTPTVIRYLDTPPTAEHIRSALALLDLPAIKLMRAGEKRFKELGLSKTDSAETLITAMEENPILIERPVVLTDTKAAIGRPPEAVLDLFK